jgi:NADPH:quinone reductase-like Zn-dependent oxidoreductase
MRYRCFRNELMRGSDMKAYALTAPDRPATLVDLPDPVAPDGGVLIRVRAASVNGFDLYEANGYLAQAMPHDYPVVIGRDLAGVVAAVADGRTDVAVGDEVIGFVPSTPPLHIGTWAELVPAGPDCILTPKPRTLPFEAAAAIPLAGATAQDAVDAAGVRAGDVVLVVGATGGVGSVAVQLAAQLGAMVIATAADGDDAAFVRSLGAAETVDYRTGDVVKDVRGRHPEGIDVLLDFVDRDDAFTAVCTLVREGGRIATTLGAADAAALAASGATGSNVRGMPTPEKLARLAEQVAAGSLRIEIQQTFPLDDAESALGAFAGRTVGKIVLVTG